MSSSLLFTLSTVSFLSAGLFLAVSVALWFLLRIPDAIAFLTKRDIRGHRNGVRNTENNRRTNTKASPLPEKKQKQPAGETYDDGSAKTEYMDMTSEKTLPLRPYEMENEEDDGTSATTALNPPDEGLPKGSDTVILDGDVDPAEMTAYLEPEASENGLTMIEDIVLIHTDEVIE